MELEIATETRIDEGVVLVGVAIGGVDSLHTHVETQDEIVEVQAQTQSVGHGDLLVELVESELSTGLLSIVTQRPDVTCIDECSTIELPEQERTIFQVEVYLHVTRLIDEVNASVGASEATWSESAHTPSAHAVGTSREVAFLERQHLTITIWPGNADVGVSHQLVVLVELPEAGVVEVELCILRIGNAKERVLSFLVFVEVGCVGKKSKQVARCLHIGTQGVVAMTIGDAETNLHDEEVLVVIAQDGIAIAHAVEIVVLEGIADPRHVHIVQVEQVEAILQVAGRLIPAITPSRREHTAMELRSVLHVVGQRELTGGGASTCKIAR